MQIRLKVGRKGGWLKQLGRTVKPGDVVTVEDKLAEGLLSTGEFEKAEGERGRGGEGENTAVPRKEEDHRLKTGATKGKG